MDKYSIYHRCISALFYIASIVAILIAIIFGSIDALIFLIGLVLSERLGLWLKVYICKPLFLRYGVLKNGKHYIPILGHGERPDTAMDCGFHLTGSINKNRSWGFPSGHSFIAGYITGYLLNYIITTKLNNINIKNIIKNNIFVTISILFVICVSIISVYARVKIAKCHTWNQGIIGNVLGIIFGYVYYKFIKYKSKI
jgi:membrane-associated phospholipid phosphatase